MTELTLDETHSGLTLRARAGDVVTLEPGTYREPRLELPSGVTLRGRAGAAPQAPRYIITEPGVGYRGS